ncbi:MAG: hypothetical protein ACRYFS_23085 [Janthinobacterium lividum]
MKPMMFVPPAQAEALYDTQDDLRDDLRLDDRVTRLPWRDEDNSEETFSYTLTSSAASDPVSRRPH